MRTHILVSGKRRTCKSIWRTFWRRSPLMCGRYNKRLGAADVNALYDLCFCFFWFALCVVTFDQGNSMVEVRYRNTSKASVVDELFRWFRDQILAGELAKVDFVLRLGDDRSEE